MKTLPCLVVASRADHFNGISLFQFQFLVFKELRWTEPNFHLCRIRLHHKMGPGVTHCIRCVDLLNAAGDLGFGAGVVFVSWPTTPATALCHRSGYCECEYQKYCLDFHNISLSGNSYAGRVRLTQGRKLVGLGLVCSLPRNRLRGGRRVVSCSARIS